MTTRTTPARITFCEERGPLNHVVEWRLYDSESNRIWCLRCRTMIDVRQWARPCGGVPERSGG